MTRNLVKKCSASAVALDRPSPTDSSGNKVSARAVTPPVAETTIIPSTEAEKYQTNPRAPATRTGPRPEAHQASNASEPSSTNVLTRWTGTITVRAAEASSATHSASTRTAPTSDSEMMKIPDNQAAVRICCPFSKVRSTQMATTATMRAARALVTRCVNSTARAPSRPPGMISPSQVGQEGPHPAPDPLARTKAP